MAGIITWGAADRLLHKQAPCLSHSPCRRNDGDADEDDEDGDDGDDDENMFRITVMTMMKTLTIIASVLASCTWQPEIEMFIQILSLPYRVFALFFPNISPAISKEIIIAGVN